jgi:hypothetical protein
MAANECGADEKGPVRGSSAKQGLGTSKSMNIVQHKANLFNTAPPKSKGLPPVFDLDECLRRGEHEVFTVVTTLTPDIARRLLERNDSNRRLQPRQVQDLVHAIQTGTYVLNGETIIVSRDGLLNDGQHRCQAVIETGMSIPAIIVFGVGRDTRSTVDTGAKRTIGNILSMHKLGCGNPNGVAAVARGVLQYDNRMMLSRTVRFEPAEYLEFVREFGDELNECYSLGLKIRARYTVSPGMVGAAIFICARVHPETAQTLCTQLITGLNLKVGDPAVALARRYAEHTTGRGKLTYVEQAALFIKAFNDIREKQRVSIVKWITSEAFPDPR